MWSKDAGYASSTGDGDDRYHEPTTDELRITHPVEDPDQPSLFERSDDPVAPDLQPTAPESSQDDSPRTPEN